MCRSRFVSGSLFCRKCVVNFLFFACYKAGSHWYSWPFQLWGFIVGIKTELSYTIKMFCILCNIALFRKLSNHICSVWFRINAGVSTVCVKSVSTACRSFKFTAANLRTSLGVIGYPRMSNPNWIHLIIIQIHTQEVSMSKANDLTGRTFGLLKVLRRVEDVKPGRPMWLCECRCGKVSWNPPPVLRSRTVSSPAVVCGIKITRTDWSDWYDLWRSSGSLSGLFCTKRQSSLGMPMRLRERCFCSLRKSAPLQNDILRLQMPSLEIRSDWSRIWLSQSDWPRVQGQSKIKRSILAMPLPKLRQDRPYQQLSAAPFQPIRTL